MGQRSSKPVWANQAAAAYALYLNQIFGPPASFNPRPGGVAVWDEAQLQKIQLFKMRNVFSKVMVKDEQIVQAYPKPHYTYVTVVVKVPGIDPSLVCKLPDLYNGSGYDFQTGHMYLRTYSLEAGVAILNVLVAVLSGAISDIEVKQSNAITKAISALYQAQDGKAKLVPGQYRKQYSELLNKLDQLASKAQVPAAVTVEPTQASLDTKMYERFANPGLYNDGLVSNDPLVIALAEDRNDLFYTDERPSPDLLPGGLAHGPNDLPSELGTWNPAMGPVFRGKGPTLGIEHLKIHPACKGACAQRAVDQLKKDKIEHFDPEVPTPGFSKLRTTDPRWVYGGGDLYYSVGSDIMTIDRQYGTVSQKQRYPTLAEFNAYGTSTLIIPKEVRMDKNTVPINYKGVKGISPATDPPV